MIKILKITTFLSILLLTACPQDEQCKQECQNEFPFTAVSDCECDAFGFPMIVRALQISPSSKNQSLLLKPNNIFKKENSYIKINGNLKGKTNFKLSSQQSSCLFDQKIVSGSLTSSVKRKGVFLTTSLGTKSSFINNSALNASMPNISIRQSFRKKGSSHKGIIKNNSLRLNNCSTSINFDISKNDSGVRYSKLGQRATAKVNVACENGYSCSASYKGSIK